MGYKSRKLAFVDKLVESIVVDGYVPIGSLPYIAPEDYPYIVERDPMEPRLELASEDKDAEIGDATPERLQPKRRITPVTTPWTSTLDTNSGAIASFAGCSRNPPPSR